jgi:hypothetical protein
MTHTARNLNCNLLHKYYTRRIIILYSKLSGSIKACYDYFCHIPKLLEYLNNLKLGDLLPRIINSWGHKCRTVTRHIQFNNSIRLEKNHLNYWYFDELENGAVIPYRRNASKYTHLSLRHFVRCSFAEAPVVGFCVVGI